MARLLGALTIITRMCAALAPYPAPNRAVGEDDEWRAYRRTDDDRKNVRRAGAHVPRQAAQSDLIPNFGIIPAVTDAICSHWQRTDTLIMI